MRMEYGELRLYIPRSAIENSLSARNMLLIAGEGKLEA